MMFFPLRPPDGGPSQKIHVGLLRRTMVRRIDKEEIFLKTLLSCRIIY